MRNLAATPTPIALCLLMEKNSICKYLLLLFLLLPMAVTLPAQQGVTPDAEQLRAVPKWAEEAIWYQIFVERFRNGDTTNDPTPRDMKGGDPEYLPPNWSITPWGHDWYKREDWLDKLKVEGFYHQIQARRFGGDLQGVIDKLDYLSDLGITAIYFNPLNDAPSLHKYDARYWRHIDHTFGPDPEGDLRIMESEQPDDPSTWKWTRADRLFLDLIDSLHRRGIRLIMDYSWNHTGLDFWALKDVHQKGAASKFSDWYNIIQYDDPATPEDEFDYEGWAGYRFMPVVRKDIIPPDDKVMPFEGNLHSTSLKNHIFNVSRRWLDPNGDGNPSDGVDGFRLDVAAEIPMGFWREYRKVVRAVNPDAYLVGEVWWLEWPGKLLNPKQFLGDQFDAVMNYRWYRVARGFFARGEPVLSATEFVKQIELINRGIGRENLQAMMNVAATHDSPRLSTSLYNKGMYKYRAKPSDNPDYKINKPDAATLQEQKLLLVHQFTYPGAPHIWYGDEVGMWGADDPDCRKPMLWSDLDYEVERSHYFPGRSRPADTPRVDWELLSFYKELIALRKKEKLLSYGNFSFVYADDSTNVLAYKRFDDENEILVFFNLSDRSATLHPEWMSDKRYDYLIGDEKNRIDYIGKDAKITLKPKSWLLLKKRK